MNDNEQVGDTRQQHPLYGSFGSGVNSGRMTSTPGLEQEQEQYNSEAPHSYQPQSTLSQIGFSPVAQNASAPSMQSRYNSFTGSVMPNTNTGASESTAETALKLRFAGTDEA